MSASIRGQNATFHFPAADCSRIPYGMYLDPEIYALEQQRIFHGPVWNYLALEAEIPEPGDFRVVAVGDTPVIVNRDREGRIHAMVNRCAHRGSIVQRAAYGNARAHTRCYHQWSYDFSGRLLNVPFQKGIGGKGGLSKDFDKSCHSLQRLHVQTLSGVIFGSFSGSVKPREDYLGPVFAHQVRRLFTKPVRILGYQRQRIFGNWKLYTDNLRDPNHGGLLHMFQITFGIARLSSKGGAQLDAEGKHNLSWAAQGGRAEADSDDGYAGTDRGDMAITLRDPSMLRYAKEFPRISPWPYLPSFPAPPSNRSATRWLSAKFVLARPTNSISSPPFSAIRTMMRRWPATASARPISRGLPGLFPWRMARRWSSFIAPSYAMATAIPWWNSVAAAR